MSYEHASVVHPDMPPRLVTPESKGRRPFGLKAIILLMLLQVIVSIGIFALYAYLNSNWADESIEGVIEFSSWFDLVTLPLLLVLRLVAVVGLWQMKRWAWFLTMCLLAYAMAFDAISFFRGDAYYIAMVLNVLTVFYLNLREVQSLFIRPGERKS